ncbi:MAG: ribosome-associated translation inhibitor RaiA [Planctomycetota bacterium]
MKVDIVSRHVDIPSSVEDYAREKVGKLDRYLRKIAKVEVVLDRNADKFSAEMRLHAEVRGARVVAHVSNEDARAAVDLLMDKMERQLVRLKERRQSRYHKDKKGIRHNDHSDSGYPGKLSRDDDEEDLTYDDIINGKS